jgi:serine/threonine-protein kinase
VPDVSGGGTFGRGSIGVPDHKGVTTTLSFVTLSRLSDRVGQVLSDRYRLIAPIGTGSSASVYLADDVTLRRRVAVKILHDALASDDAFLRRFRAEAQAAAALNHPHIMSVFDWGHDDVPFLVTEYLGGGSLRTLLDQQQRLTPAQALVIGLESARGLDYAHRRGFVHRDIKPANLLFDEEARLRIADFGLARALAEAAWTEPQGAVLGTARYASPEQARGETVDGRSDVYSLGLVIIEAVTGSVPFAGDTTIGTLMARIDQPVLVPTAVGPIGPALEAAGRPRPADRPDAAEFTKLLMAASELLDRPEPLVLAGTMVHHHDVVPDRDPTVLRHPEAEPDIMSAPPGTVIDGIRVIPDQADLLTAEPGTTTDGIRVIADPQSVGVFDHARDDDPAGGAPPTAAGPAAGHRRRWPSVVLALLLVAAIASGGFGYWYREVRVVTHPVPVLVDTNVADLDATIGDMGFTVERTDAASDLVPVGQILAQDPAAGTALAEGGTLQLTVSSGPPPIAVPVDLVGKSLADATAELELAGLRAGDVSRQFDEKIARDVVMAVAEGTPAELPRGAGVPLVVSDGPKPRVIPGGLVGVDEATAVAAIQQVGLKASSSQDYSETVAIGVVISVKPTSGTSVPRGSTVSVVVSQGPQPIIVPDVSKLSVTDAATRLQAAGLTVSSVKGSPLGTVSGTDPKAGSSVKKGTAVTIITG